MKYAAFAIAAVALAASLSQASAEPRNPASDLVPAAEAVRVLPAAASIVEGRQATVALSAAERAIIDRNVSHR